MGPTVDKEGRKREGGGKIIEHKIEKMLVNGVGMKPPYLSLFRLEGRENGVLAGAAICAGTGYPVGGTRKKFLVCSVPGPRTHLPSLWRMLVCSDPMADFGHPKAVVFAHSTYGHD
eukprot:scaffold127566_cov40-Cyclotella_meneghiniana.AAC.3